jgi:hypothetical protein
MATNHEDCREILDLWNSKGIIIHEPTVKDLQIAVRSSLMKHGKEKTITAINRYAEMYHDEEYVYCEYAWSLPEFLRKATAMPDYFDDGLKWVNYLRFKDGHILLSGNMEDEYRRLLSYLRAMPYKEYLQTEHWRHFKGEFLKSVNNFCQICGSTNQIKVHHKTYKNRGRETFNDVMALCKTCHNKTHGIAV